jgi:hypothetical protein
VRELSGVLGLVEPAARPGRLLLRISSYYCHICVSVLGSKSVGIQGTFREYASNIEVLQGTFSEH